MGALSFGLSNLDLLSVIKEARSPMKTSGGGYAGPKK
jgi:hypothetical protein